MVEIIHGNEIHVVAGIITNEADLVLIAKRPEGKPLAGYWEFPGGKLEAGESGMDALRRELREEINVNVLEAIPWFSIQHQYPNKKVSLEVWQVQGFEGAPIGNEGQEIRWVTREALSNYHFPEANTEIIKRCQDQKT